MADGNNGSSPGWCNWSGAVQFQPAHRHSPTSMDALQRLVRELAASGQRLRVEGSGHSFVPLVQTDQHLLSLSQLRGPIDISDHSATVHAGTTLHELGPTLWSHGLSMGNLGDIDVQALAGAVATGTHGTGIGLGSISAQVEGLGLVMPDGELVECSAEQEPDLFAAARVALGALGVMATIRLGLRPAYRLAQTKRPMTLEDCLRDAPALARMHRHFEFFWVPHSEVCLAKWMDETSEPASQGGRMSAIELMIENGALEALSRYARAWPSQTPRVAGVIASIVRGGKTQQMIAPSYRAFATRRLVRFNEMEYELPAERGPEAIRELAEFVRAKHILVHFPVEYRYVKADDIWLSPFYQRDTAAISIHQYRGMDYQDYFNGAEAIFRNHGGRPHWGKMHSGKAAQLAPLYPRWDDFMALREKIDPRGVFLNDYLHGLFGV